MRASLLLFALLALPAMAQADVEVTFGSAPGVTLAGTVSVPDGPGPFPAVVLVSGSGLQDRDGGPDNALAPAGFRMYRDLAEGLRQAGVMVLRYDERGAGASTAGPEPQDVTTLDYAADVAAAVRLLAERDDVRWIGVVGHSEGGLIAPMVANDEGAVDGIVMVAGQGVSGREVILEQNRVGLAGAGLSAEATDAFVADVDGVFQALAATAGAPLDDAALEPIRADFEAAFAGLPPEEAAKLGLTEALIPMVVAQQMQAVQSAWFRTFLSLDPAEHVRALEVPALALYFELDTQVSVGANAGPMRQALSASGSPDWQVTTLDGINHPMQRAETGAAAEYRTLAATIDPAVPAAIADWVLATAGE